MEYPCEEESIRLNAHRLMSERGYLNRVANAGSKLARWYHYLEQLERPGPLSTKDPLVQPRIFPPMDGLETPPWRDASESPETATLEQSVEVIRTEIEAVSASQHLDYTGVTILSGGQWTVMPLFVFGEHAGPLMFGKDFFPKTTAIIRGMADACAAFPLADIIFSAHAPQTHLRPHFSWDPFRLRLHLGLRVPEKCGIRVGSEAREWQEGKVLAFHDACEHGTWNESEQTRIVLIVDVWHPDLTLIEREAILACFRKKEIRGALMRTRVPAPLQPLLTRVFAQREAVDPLIAKYWSD